VSSQTELSKNVRPFSEVAPPAAPTPTDAQWHVPAAEDHARSPLAFYTPPLPSGDEEIDPMQGSMAGTAEWANVDRRVSAPPVYAETSNAGPSQPEVHEVSTVKEKEKAQ
jgi:hypothetical protein